MKFSNRMAMRLNLLKHPQFLKNPVGATGKRLLWQLYAKHQSLLQFTTEYGFKFEGQPQDIGVGSLFYQGQYEWGELQIWQQLLDRPHMTVLDIGANFGLYSLMTAAYSRYKKLNDVKIFSFEPNSVEYSKFERNIALNDYSEIKIFPLALSNKATTCPMVIPANGMGVFGHLLEDPSNTREQDTVENVETIDLDSWCDRNGIEEIDLIKIDVEGHELKVLEGAKGLLANRAIKNLLMEIGHGEWKAAIALLQQYGYFIELIGHDGKLNPFQENHLTGWDNILARPIS